MKTTDRLYEAAKSMFAAIGVLCAMTLFAGGISVVEPHAGWSTFVSGALWIGGPLAIGLNRYFNGSAG